MNNYQFTQFMKYSRQKGAVEKRGGQGGGSYRRGKKRLNMIECHAPDSEREQYRECIERSIKRNS